MPLQVPLAETPVLYREPPGKTYVSARRTLKCTSVSLPCPFPPSGLSVTSVRYVLSFFLVLVVPYFIIEMNKCQTVFSKIFENFSRSAFRKKSLPGCPILPYARAGFPAKNISRQHRRRRKCRDLTPVSSAIPPGASARKRPARGYTHLPPWRSRCPPGPSTDGPPGTRRPGSPRST